MTVWLVLAAVVLLVANGVFVAKEFALIASRRTKLQGLAEEGSLSARLALEAASQLPLQLASSQLGVTMASLGLGAVAEPMVSHGLENAFSAAGIPNGVTDTLAVLIGLAIVVFFHMVFGEMVPKYVALADPERTLMALAIPNRIYVALFRPLIRALGWLGRTGTRLFGVEPRTDLATLHTAEEIASMLAASREEGLIEEMAHDLLSGALDFGERPLSDVMVPRAQITWVSRDATVAEAEQAIVTSGHSRLLVAGTDLDDIVGFVHAKDLLTVPAHARNRPLPLARIRRVLILPAHRPLDEVLVAMRRSRTHVAVVVEEERHVIGLATLEDVLEDLVGDIRDESDQGPRRITSRRRVIR
ncbi:MAG: magnesium and cobalt exporter, family [Acidimicrobiaceae bacterium]